MSAWSYGELTAGLVAAETRTGRLLSQVEKAASWSSAHSMSRVIALELAPSENADGEQRAAYDQDQVHHHRQHRASQYIVVIVDLDFVVVARSPSDGVLRRRCVWCSETVAPVGLCP
jgi:hypothetical protein